MKFISLIVFVISLSNGFAQNAFQDAMSMRKMINADGVIQVEPNTESDLILKRIVDFYATKNDSSNPYLNPFFQGRAFSIGTASTYKYTSGGYLSGLDVTKYANAVASLMIGRARQELIIAFFNRFKKFVEKNPEAGILFPQTTGNLGNLLAYKYPEMIPALRVGFLEDIRKIAYNLTDVFVLPKYQHLLRDVPEVKILLRSVSLAQDVVSGNVHPAEAITQLATFPEWNNNSLVNWRSAVQLANIISQSIRKVNAISTSDNHASILFDSTQGWVSMGDIRKLTGDTITFSIYLGLIYQLAEKQNIYWVSDKDTVRFTALLARYAHYPIPLANKISRFVQLTEGVTNAYRMIEKKRGDGVALTNDDYTNYANTSLDVIEYGLDMYRDFKEDFSLPAHDYVKTLRKINNLYRHTYKEEYTQAVADAMAILTDIQETAKQRHTDSDKLSVVIPGLFKYATFMANVADAKTAEDVEAALDNAILPVGSSSVKKYGSLNVAVQSYLGAFARVGRKLTDSDFAWADAWGVAAPIGISVSHGFRQMGSLSVFISLVDLGAIVDYQLKVDSTISSSGEKVPVVNKDYKIKLGQIFSPGGYLVYGFGANIPMALGIGAQYGPGLSKINIDSGNPMVLNPRWRYNIFLAVDLPFFNLFNLSKSRIK